VRSFFLYCTYRKKFSCCRSQRICFPFQCSVTCGRGVQKRELKCSFKGRNGRYRTVPARKCKRSRRPSVSLHKTCAFAACRSGSNDSDASSPQVTTRHAYARHHRRSGDVHRRRRARWITGTWQKVGLFEAVQSFEAL